MGRKKSHFYGQTWTIQSLDVDHKASLVSAGDARFSPNLDNKGMQLPLYQGQTRRKNFTTYSASFEEWQHFSPWISSRTTRIATHSPFEEEDLALEVPLAEVAAGDDEVELVLVEGRLGLVDVAARLGHALRQEVALQHREAPAEHVLRRGQVRPQELICKKVWNGLNGLPCHVSHVAFRMTLPDCCLAKQQCL